MREPPYPTVVKAYGQALVELARVREDVVCLSADLTRQCEVDLFRDELPDRFINVGMAEANMMGIAGGLARRGLRPFVHTFGVFATRRPFDQIVNAIAYPGLPVCIVGFMPGLSSPGGPSHQAIDDVALMRALPNMTVLDVVDAGQIRQALPLLVDHDGPVYLRLKRGETPALFDEGDPALSLTSAAILASGTDVALFGQGMMLPAVLAARTALAAAGVAAAVVHVPVVKPLDVATVAAVAAGVPAAVSAENHSVIGGLGSAVAEVIAEAGLACRLRRVGVQDTFARGAATAGFLFDTYGLTVQAVVDAAWSALDREGPAPRAVVPAAQAGEYAPV
jgi:transketolase